MVWRSGFTFSARSMSTSKFFTTRVFAHDVLDGLDGAQSHSRCLMRFWVLDLILIRQGSLSSAAMRVRIGPREERGDQRPLTSSALPMFAERRGKAGFCRCGTRRESGCRTGYATFGPRCSSAGICPSPRKASGFNECSEGTSRTTAYQGISAALRDSVPRSSGPGGVRSCVAANAAV